jgi:hypothetical protein
MFDEAEQKALLGSWRQLLQVCLGLYHALDKTTLLPEVAAGIVQARSEIARIKTLLRQSGVQVTDLPDELVVADASEVTHHLKLLATYRRNLSLLLQQQQNYGDLAPPAVVHSIESTRHEIAQLKRRLREWQAPVEDHPNDVA